MTENTVLARFADEWLDNWLKSQNRKPLILRGARQVGKSFLVRQLAKRNKRDLAEINFEANPKLGKLFETNEPKNILMVLEQEFQKKLGPESILFFDEIQASPSAIAALRYFYELYPHIPVLAAGSLLEFALQELQFSMPVGRISFLWIYPLRFREFLRARQKDILLDAVTAVVNNKNTVSNIKYLAKTGHAALLRELALYAFTGGMPEAICILLKKLNDNNTQNQALSEVSTVHQEILISYRSDFSKYRKRIPLEILHAVLDSLPQLVGQAKIKYSNITKEYRSEIVRKAIDCLESAGVVKKVSLSRATGIPIGASEDSSVFKLLPLDIGLFISQTFEHPNAIRPVENLFEKWTQGNTFERAWLGQIAEVLVGQALTSQLQSGQRLHYWLREGKSANAEVDYLMQYGTNILPVEVKAGASGSLRSLNTLMAEKELKQAIRFDLNYPSQQEIDIHCATGDNKNARAKYTLHNYPLYFADWWDELAAKL